MTMADYYSLKLILLILFASSLFMATSNVAAQSISSSESTLAVRLKLENQEGSSNCWDSLFQLQSCTGEVILFFLNGETYLGPSCCRAIRTIEHDCWPSMLGSLGFTSEEGDILRGYCDASSSSSTVNPPSQVNATTKSSHVAVP